MGLSALIVVVPEAEDVVGRWRERDDPSASRGVPAHVTLLYPFLAPERIDDGVVAELEHYFAGVDGFGFRLARVGRFPTTVYLMPEPSSAFSELTRSLARRWDCQPYDGGFPDTVPHLTVSASDDEARREEAADAVAPRLPIAAVVVEAQLWVADDDGWWERRAVLPMAPPA